MAHDFTFHISTTRFDEDYSPASSSRITTNFANLARGEGRRQNLRNVLGMIGRRVNDLARAGNPHRDRYDIRLDIVSVRLRFTAGGTAHDLPLFEMLETGITDRHTAGRTRGIVGNNFSSYLRDYDFSVLLPSVNDAATGFIVPGDFGDLHGGLFQHFLDSPAYRERFPLSPVICISVSTSRTYRRTDSHHPVLGVEYRQDDHSLTDAYFARMGLQVRYFMPPGSVAPLAFYFRSDLLTDYSDLQLVGTIGTMETFQKVYRPEIYNANSPAGTVYRPSLEGQDYTRTPIDYDRVERCRLARTQGMYAAQHIMEPHGELLAEWAADHSTLAR